MKIMLNRLQYTYIFSSKLPKSKIELDTINSFNYQWTNLFDSQYILDNESWKNNVDEYILDELSVTREWIRGKTVIDVGCGGGRWSYGFAKLGSKVISVDVSEGPCSATRQNVPQAEVITADLFELPYIMKGRKLDIIWCWGVIHHISDPHLAFRTLTKLMHQNSFLHLYVYSFDRGIKVKMLRRFLRLFSLKNRDKIICRLVKSGILHGSIHELFDSLSTQINHEMSEHQLKKWFAEYGLEYHKYVPQWAKSSRDLFVSGFIPAKNASDSCK
jgi:2-polyprenyl-3-methyl-5-hydroxy-6-metoxy-1,4-benzoquinol methylase